MTKLTEAEATILAAIPDWSAPYEVRDRTGVTMLLGHLGGLVTAGLAEYGPANNTYRQTPAGRALLAGNQP